MAGLALTSCADLLRVTRALGLTDPDDIDEVARALGLQVHRDPLSPEPQSPMDRPLGRDQDDPHRESRPDFDLRQTAPTAEWPPEAHSDALLPTTVTREAAGGKIAIDGDETSIAELTAADRLPSWVRSTPLTPAALLEPARARAILGELAATLSASAAADIDRLVEAIARGRTVRRIPALVRRTMVLGIQLLLDSGPAMRPFRPDLTAIARDIGAVAGESVEILWCAGNPWTVWAPGRPPSEYIPPPPGVPVIAVSDLGLRVVPGHVDNSGPGLWRELAALLRWRGSHLVALMPLEPACVPMSLSRHIAAVPWDRSTTVRQVRAHMINVVGA